jgi:hypothetical protein
MIIHYSFMNPLGFERKLLLCRIEHPMTGKNYKYLFL